MSTMSAEEVIKILNACRDLNLTSLKFEGLELAFRTAEKPAIMDYLPPSPEVSTLPIDDGIDVDPKLQEEFDEIMREEELNNLMIEDPEAYEEVLASLDEHEEEEINDA